MSDDFETVTVIGVVADHGSVVTFETDDGRTLAADHRSAQGLVALLEDLGEVTVTAEGWQFV